MSEPIEGFFDELAHGRNEPLLRRASGSLRIDLEDGTATERWLVTLDKGDIVVSHRNTRADSVIRTSKALFEGMVTGRVNAMAAVLRGVVSLEGNPTLLVLFQRALPGPPRAATKPTAAPTRGRT